MSKTQKRFLHIFLTITLSAIGVLGLIALTASKPELKTQKPTRPIPVVRTVQVRTGEQAVRVAGSGTVRPLQEINLVPQVGGKVVFVAASLVNGGNFKAGDILLRLEAADYQLAVTSLKAKIKDAESKLLQAEEEASASREEWRIHSGRGNSTPPPLAAREPQLEAARAVLEANKADLEKALLNLARTEIRAPFNGRVGIENVDEGQYVSPGQTLASLFSTDAAEVVVPLEDKQLAWFHVPGFTAGEGEGAQAVVRARLGGVDSVWPGRVVRAEGKISEKTRMVNVVVRIDQPYSRKPPLAMGLYVEIEIEGRNLSSAALAPRPALRADNIVWVVDNEGFLHFRKVEVARFQGEDILLASGLEDGDMVVVSPLPMVTDGMKVRLSGTAEADRS